MDRLRGRLNVLPLLAAAQWLGVMAAFWMRFLPPLRPFDFTAPPPSATAFVVGLTLCAVPAVLPRGYFEPRAFERGRLYRRLGLRMFRHLAPDGGWVNARLRRVDPRYRVVANRRSLREHVEASRTNERWHLAFLIAGALTQIVAARAAAWGWLAALTISNIVFNLYPIMHQRYKRSRVTRAFRR